MQTPQLHPKNTQLLIWPGLPKKNSLERSSYHGNAWERMGTLDVQKLQDTPSVWCHVQKKTLSLLPQNRFWQRGCQIRPRAVWFAQHTTRWMSMQDWTSVMSSISFIHENCLLCPRFPDTAPKGSFYQAFIDLATFSPSQDFVGARKKPRSWQETNCHILTAHIAEASEKGWARHAPGQFQSPALQQLWRSVQEAVFTKALEMLAPKDHDHAGTMLPSVTSAQNSIMHQVPVNLHGEYRWLRTIQPHVSSSQDLRCCISSPQSSKSWTRPVKSIEFRHEHQPPRANLSTGNVLRLPELKVRTRRQLLAIQINFPGKHWQQSSSVSWGCRL